jgi:8-oxo-(d)GTP phosphatase
VSASAPVRAAGAVVWRPAGSGGGRPSSPRPVEVLLIHRPKYDDWSLPKGKLDPGEHLLAAAVREVAEETGLRVRLGVPLPSQEYDTGAGTKRVQYWAARPVHDDQVDGYRPNAEVDDLRWLPLDRAREQLTYDRDRAVLAAFAVRGFGCEPLLVLRHAQAMRRDTWVGSDRERPLAPEGEQRARALVPLLTAFGITRVLSSDAVRCAGTVRPYAEAAGLRVEPDHRLSEEGAEETALVRRLDDLLRRDEPTVVSTHRPVLPRIFTALGVVDPTLLPGAFVVVHHQGRHLHATEHHHP